jgi:hypothetical protein
MLTLLAVFIAISATEKQEGFGPFHASVARIATQPGTLRVVLAIASNPRYSVLSELRIHPVPAVSATHTSF